MPSSKNRNNRTARRDGSAICLNTGAFLGVRNAARQEQVLPGVTRRPYPLTPRGQCPFSEAKCDLSPIYPDVRLISLRPSPEILQAFAVRKCSVDSLTPDAAAGPLLISPQEVAS